MTEPEPLAAAPPEEYPFWSYQDIGLLAALTLPLMAVSVFATAGFFRLLTSNLPRAVELLTAQFLFYGLWFFCLYGWIRLRYDRPFWRSLAWWPSRYGFGGCVTAGMLTALSVIVLGVLLRPPQTDLPMMELLKDRTSICLVGLFGVTLGPLCEELAFRGFLLPLLARSLKALPGVVLTAVPFMLLHGPQYNWSWKHLALIGLAGVAFGWMRLRSGSTAAATVMHGAYNLVFFLGLLAQRKELIS